MFSLFRQIYLKTVPHKDQINCTEATSKVVDIDKAIENTEGSSPLRRLQTSLKRIHKTSHTSTQNTAPSQEEAMATSADKKGSKEKCKVM